MQPSEIPPSYRDAFDANLDHLEGFAGYTDLLPEYYTNHPYLKKIVYDKVKTVARRTHRDLSSIYIQTFRIALSSIARDIGLDTELLEVKKGVVGGVGVQSARKDSVSTINVDIEISNPDVFSKLHFFGPFAISQPSSSADPTDNPKPWPRAMAKGHGQRPHGQRP